MNRFGTTPPHLLRDRTPALEQEQRANPMGCHVEPLMRSSLPPVDGRSDTGRRPPTQRDGTGKTKHNPQTTRPSPANSNSRHSDTAKGWSAGNRCRGSDQTAAHRRFRPFRSSCPERRTFSHPDPAKPALCRSVRNPPSPHSMPSATLQPALPQPPAAQGARQDRTSASARPSGAVWPHRRKWPVRPPAGA